MNTQTRERCQTVLEMLRDDVKVFFDTATHFAQEIAQTLGLAEADNFAVVTEHGLNVPETCDQTIRLLDEFKRGSTTQRAMIELCSALGHEFVAGEDGQPRYCQVCHVLEDEAPDLGFEDEEDDPSYDVIRLHCQAVIEGLVDACDASYELGQSSVNEITALLEMPPLYEYDAERCDGVIRKGIMDARTQAQAIQAVGEFAEGKALQYAYVLFCTALGHEFHDDGEGGPSWCTVCGIEEGQEPELGF